MCIRISKTSPRDQQKSSSITSSAMMIETPLSLTTIFFPWLGRHRYYGGRKWPKRGETGCKHFKRDKMVTVDLKLETADTG